MLRSTGKALFKLTAATTVVYGAGVALATQNNAFNEIFTDKVPLGEEAVDYAQSLLNTTKSEYNIKNFKDKFSSLENTLSISKASGAQSTTIEAVKESPKPKKTEKPVNKLNLPHLSIQAKDSQIQQVIQEFNAIVNKLNAGQFDKDEKFEKIQQIVKDLDSTLVKLSSKSEEEFNARLKEEVSAKEVETLQTLQKSFQATLDQKADQHQKELQQEVIKAKEALEAYYKNQSKLAAIKTQDEFAQLISESVEKERNGKLSQFKDLNNKLENLQKLVLSIDDHLTNAELKVKLQLSLNKLKFKLQSDKIQDLSNEIKELNVLAKESKNEVITSALNAIDAETVKNGLLTQSQLITRFGLLAPELRSASLLPPYAGVLGHVSAKIFSSLLLKKEGHAEGKDIESLIARVQNNLINNRLDEAVEEVSQLKGWSRRLADDWIFESRKRLEVEFLVNLIDLESRTLY